MKAIVLLNIDAKPSFTRIPKGSVVEIVYEMPGNYVMINYEDGFYPVPLSNIKKIEEK